MRGRQAKILVAGRPASGRAMILAEPISFWGGVDPASGCIIDARHPQNGEETRGRVLFLPGTIGSSSAASVLLELVHRGIAPAALVLHEPDAILLLGLIVAREMGLSGPPALQLDRRAFAAFEGAQITVAEDGKLTRA
jgi:predicted aconitase with swiveling domain